jgi:hypothetical protein
MTNEVSKEDLRSEFYNDFYGTYPSRVGISQLALLIRYPVLKVRKYEFPQEEFQPRLLDENFLKHFYWTAHLENYRGATNFILNKMIHDYCDLLLNGYAIVHEPWYFGYRADLGIVPLGSDKANDIILAVEIGNTEIIKIIEGITNLPNLRAIWHVPDVHTYFVWSRGKNSGKLREVLSKHKNYLDKLYEDEVKERRDKLEKGLVWIK